MGQRSKLDKILQNLIDATRALLASFRAQATVEKTFSHFWWHAITYLPKNNIPEDPERPFNKCNVYFLAKQLLLLFWLVVYLFPIMRSNKRVNFEHLLIKPESVDLQYFVTSFQAYANVQFWLLQPDKDETKSIFLSTRLIKGLLLRQLIMRGSWLTSTYSFKFKLKFRMLYLFCKYLFSYRYDISKQCLIGNLNTNREKLKENCIFQKTLLL